MAARGRGRGRGAGSTSFNPEQLAAMGATASDTVPVPITEPSPLFPPLNRKPVPLPESVDINYMLILRQDFIDHMQMFGTFSKLPEEDGNSKSQQEIEKLLAQLPSAKDKFDWKLFPTELRPKAYAKRSAKKVANKLDIETRLQHLEQLEEKTDERIDVKEEAAAADLDEEMMEAENYEDEDVDDGTDYANNYFDNGEAYEEEDDNLDDGPIY